MKDYASADLAKVLTFARQGDDHSLVQWLSDIRKNEPERFESLHNTPMGPMMCWAAGHVVDYDCLRVLSEYFPSNVIDAEGNTPLHIALLVYNKDAVLVIAGLDIIKQNKNMAGQTILHLAAATGDLDLYLNIAKSCARKTEKDNLGRTALHYAVQNRSNEIVNVIIEEYPYMVTSADHNGNTPFHVAAYHNFQDIFENLISHSSLDDINITNMSGETALALAARLNHSNIFEAYEQKVKQVYYAQNKRYFDIGYNNPERIPVDMLQLTMAAKNEALLVAGKIDTEKTFFPVYVSQSEFGLFVEEICRLKPYLGISPVRVPFVFRYGIHDIGAQFVVSRESTNLHWVDSLGSYPNTQAVLSTLSRFVPPVDIYFNRRAMQSAPTGCTVFAANSVSELITSLDYMPAKYVSHHLSSPDAMTRYLKEHKIEDFDVEDRDNHKYVCQATLFPSRTYRSCQSFKEKEDVISTIGKDESELYSKQKIAKAAATCESTDLAKAFKHYERNVDLGNGKTKVRNLRLNHKFEQAYKRNKAFIDNHGVEHISASKNAVSLKGFSEQVDKKIEIFNAALQSENRLDHQSRINTEGLANKPDLSWKDSVTSVQTSRVKG
ncbi:MAG: ankyrin repeat domain-containing protein [Alphaproteobacteria bacterium]|nr:ankyrin repeat domain-containing protein [Alphaproteobacteria bacterium]